MESFVFKKHHNKKIHTIGTDHSGDNVIEYVFCDTTITELTKENESKIIEFKDIPCEIDNYRICIHPVKETSLCYFSTWNARDGANLESTIKKYEEFNLDIHSVTFKTYRYSYKTRSLNATNIVAPTPEEVAIPTVFNYDSPLEMKSYGITFKLIEHTLNEDGTLISGKLSLSYEYFICQHCGEKISSQFHYEPKDIVTGVYVYDNEDTIKLTVLRKHLFTSKKFSWIRYYKNMYSFNKETCKMYKLENFNYAGSKYLKKKFKKSIKNLTNKSWYSVLSQMHDESDEEGLAKEKFRELVVNCMKNNFGKEYEFTDNDCVSLLKMNDQYHLFQVLGIKKQYNIKNTLLAELVLTAKSYDKSFHKYIKGKTEKEIMNYLKLNNKRLCAVINNDKVALHLSFFRYLNDINSINRLINIQRRGMHSFVDRRPKHKDFYLKYINANSEKKLLNQIEKLPDYCLIDTAKLYAMIKDKIKDYEVDFTRNIKDLHDIFDKDYRKIRQSNEKIPQNKSIAKVFKDFEVNGITYRLAKDTDELIKIGAIMDICVGGYRNDALSKQCIIVAGYDKEDKPVTCIELRKEKQYCVWQVKKRKNYLPKASENNALVKLFEDNKIKINTRDLDLENNWNRLKDEDSELLGKRKDFTYAHNVPEELRAELVG